MNEGRPEFHAELAGHVLNDDCGNIRGTAKSTDGLEHLQLHEQRYLGCRCAGYRGRPLPLVVTRAEKSMQIIWSQRVRQLGINHARSALRRSGVGYHVEVPQQLVVGGTDQYVTKYGADPY